MNFRYFKCVSLNTLREDGVSKGAFILSRLFSMGSGYQGCETHPPSPNPRIACHWYPFCLNIIKKGVLYPIVYFLKQLSPAEYNYEIYNKELLAIIRYFKQ